MSYVTDDYLFYMLFMRLAGVSSIQEVENFPSGAITRTLTDGTKIRIPIEGASTPRQVTKTSEKNMRERDQLLSRLSNSAYREKAPTEVIKKDKARLEQLNKLLQ